MALTVEGWQSYIRNVNRKIAEIDKLDEELGDVCREAREAGRFFLSEDLAKAEKALADARRLEAG